MLLDEAISLTSAGTDVLLTRRDLESPLLPFGKTGYLMIRLAASTMDRTPIP